MEQNKFKVLELPFDEAVEQSGLSNFNVDKRKGILKSWETWEKVKEVYLEEAKYLISETGENYLPEYDEPHIVLRR